MQVVLASAPSDKLNEFIVKFVSAHAEGEATFNERMLKWLLKYVEVK